MIVTWEYASVKYQPPRGSLDLFEHQLNILGRKGWEIVSVTPMTSYTPLAAWLKRRILVTGKEPVGADLLDQSFRVLNIPDVRVRKCFVRLGIETVRDLLDRTAEELLQAKNFGVSSLRIVRERLAKSGWKLKGE